MRLAHRLGAVHPVVGVPLEREAAHELVSKDLQQARARPTSARQSMRHRCTACGNEFEADDDARCPRCLRRSTVLGEGELGSDVTRGASSAARRTSGYHLPIAMVILVPYMVMNMTQWHLPFWVTFPVAFGAFALGHLVDHLVTRARRGGPR